MCVYIYTCKHIMDAFIFLLQVGYKCPSMEVEVSRRCLKHKLQFVSFHISHQYAWYVLPVAGVRIYVYICTSRLVVTYMYAFVAHEFP